jgi:hypothetical protein
VQYDLKSVRQNAELAPDQRRLDVPTRLKQKASKRVKAAIALSLALGRISVVVTAARLITQPRRKTNSPIGAFGMSAFHRLIELLRIAEQHHCFRCLDYREHIGE